jgi:hypothetical protein
MRTILTWLAFDVLLATLAAAQPARYTVNDLGTLKSGSFSLAIGVAGNEIAKWRIRHCRRIATRGLVVPRIDNRSRHAWIWGANSEALGVNGEIP